MSLKRAVIYARFSSDNQNIESIEAQENACTKYIEDHGMILIETYFDMAYSGTTSNRPRFREMIEDAKKRKFDFVIVHKYDRFARNEVDHGISEEKLNQFDVELISVKEPIENNPAGNFMKAIIKSVNQYYSDNLAEEVTKTMEIKAGRALHLGGIPALGYDVVEVNEEKKYAINPKESKAVQIIFQMYSDNFGYTAIIEKLNELGYRTKRGSAFQKNSLSEILRNEKYTGVYLYNRRDKAKRINGNKVKTNRRLKDEDKIIRIENGMPRIISNELWQDVQKKLSENVRKGAQHKAVQTYYLSGKLNCAYCGRTLIGTSRKAGRNKDLYLTYKCKNKENGKKCESKEINKTYLEQFVLQSLLHSIFTKENANDIVESYNKYLLSSKDTSKDEIHSLKKELAQIKKEGEHLLQFIMQGNSSAMVSEKLKEVEMTKQGIECKINDLMNHHDTKIIKKEKLLKTFADLHSNTQMLMNDQNKVEFKKLFSAFVEKAHIDNEFVSIEFNLEKAVGLQITKVIDLASSKKVKTRPNLDVFTSGGDGGSRTPVQKQFTFTFSERSR